MPHSLPLRLRATSRPVSFRPISVVAIVLAFALLTIICTSARGQTTQPAQGCIGTFATALVQGGMAPCTLHVDATELPLAHGRPLTAMYEWDFGDPVDPTPPPTTEPGGGTSVSPKPAMSALGASPDRPAPYGANLGYNRMPGWNAAHVYNSPGTYTVTLKITDEAGEVRSYTRSVTVMPDRRPLRRVRTFAELRAAAQAQPAAHVIVEPLTTIDCTDEIRPSRGTIIEGAIALAPPPPPSTEPTTSPTTLPIDPTVDDANLGAPVLPSLNWVRPKHGNYFQGADFLLRNLNFTAASNADDRVADPIKPLGGNTIEWCTFQRVSDPVLGESHPRYVMVKDCRDRSVVSMHGYLAWVQGQDWVIVGNVIRNSTRAHCIRCGGGERVNICFNDLTNLDRQSVDKYDQARQTITAHLAKYIGVYDNLCREGRVEIGPLGGPDGTTIPNYLNDRMSCVQIIGNRFDFRRDNRLELDHGTDGAYIAGNWIRTPSLPCIHLEDADTKEYTVKGIARDYGGRNVNDVWIRPDNTLITRAGDKKVYVAKSATNVRNETTP
jgi:PKD repeat protein